MSLLNDESTILLKENLSKGKLGSSAVTWGKNARSVLTDIGVTALSAAGGGLHEEDLGN